jgi:hypothetical protein
MAQSAPAETDSGYVFELLKDGAIVFRRADMENPNAKEALRVFMSLTFQIDVKNEEIDYFIVNSPEDWAFLSVRLVVDKQGPFLRVFEAEREPGFNSGSNPVITNIDVASPH